MDEAEALSHVRFVLAYVVGDLDDGAAFVDRALVLNPNLAFAWGASGWMKICFGDHDTAIEHEARAMRLSPLDPLLYARQFFTALAHFFAGRYDEAASWLERALRDQRSHLGALCLAMAISALTGRLVEAQKFMARLHRVDPAFRISNVADVVLPLRRPEDFARLVEGLRKAGLPE